MFARNSRLIAAAALLCLLSLLSAPAGATITVGGDAGEVSPADPRTWNSSFPDSQIGINSAKSGTVTVSGRTNLLSYCRNAYLGCNTGAAGTVTVTGSLSQWTFSGGNLVVGYSGNGNLNAQAGGQIYSGYGYLGYAADGSGTATVTGTASKWANDNDMYVGYYGVGTLYVENGGSITTGRAGYLGNFAGASGTLNVSGAGAKWQSRGLVMGGEGTGSLLVSNGGQVVTLGLMASSIGGSSAGSTGSAVITGSGSNWTLHQNLIISPKGTLTVKNGGTVKCYTRIETSLSSLKGDGTITSGLIYDGDIVLDANHPTASFGTSGILNFSGIAADLGLGNVGNATLRIADGVQISTNRASLGWMPGSNGTAIITGWGSTWTSGLLCLGVNPYGGGGVGTMTVDNGATVNTGELRFGPSSTPPSYGSLTVGNGGKVTATSVGITSPSRINLHVSGNAMLVVGSATTAGTINTSRINLYADAFLGAGSYSPITDYQGAAKSIDACKAYGATCSGGSFTVAAATLSDAGVSDVVTTGERLLITDSASGRRVGASFGTVAGGTNFKADLMGGADLSGLPADQTVLGAWNFTTNFSGDQALLSFDIGAGQTGTLSVWHYDGTTWAPFAAPDLTYGDDGIANFAVTGFSGYAVTVPEPASMILLALGGLALLRRKNGYAG